MPMGNIGTYACQKLQTDIVDYFGKNRPEMRTLGSVSFIKWLLSPQNTASWKQISDSIVSIPGKKRGVAFQIDSPFCLDLCSIDVNCNTTMNALNTSTNEIVFDLTDDPYRTCFTSGENAGEAKVLTFTMDELDRYCKEKDTSYITRKINRYLFEWEQALDKVLTNLLNGLIGTNGKGQAITNVPFWVNNSTTNTSALNPDAQWYLQQMYSDLGQDGNFGAVGGSILNKWAQFNKWKCCNDAGVDMSKSDATNPWLFYDRNFSQSYTDKDFIVMAPGAVQLVTWNRYKGDRRREVTELYTHDTVILPTSGLEVDYEWYFDYKCKVWTFDPFLHLELVASPAGGCAGNEDMEGVNGVVRVHDCSTVSVDPTCPEDVEN